MKEPVKRQRAMFVKNGQSADQKRTNAVARSDCGLASREFERPKAVVFTEEPVVATSAPKVGVRPVEKEHKVLYQHQESVGSTLIAGKTGNAGRGEVSDRHSLKEALQVLGLTLNEFSVLANTPLDTVKGWSSGKTKTPGIALALVRLLAQMR